MLFLLAIHIQLVRSDFKKKVCMVLTAFVLFFLLVIHLKSVRTGLTLKKKNKCVSLYDFVRED